MTKLKPAVIVFASCVALISACKSDDNGSGGTAGGGAGVSAGLGGAGLGGAGTGAGSSAAGTGAGVGAAGTGGGAGTGAAGTSAGTGAAGSSAGTGAAGTSAGSGAAGTTAGSGAAGTGAPPMIVNECEDFVDLTAAGADRELDWGFDIEDAPERCIKIKVGQTVTFDGDLDDHPIAADGGDANNPIQGNVESYTFPNAGVYGFICNEHDSMNGAIWVVP